MRTTLLCVAGLLLLSAVGNTERHPSDVSVHHLGERNVGIECKDGADPTVNVQMSHELGWLVVSCGRR